MRNSEINRIYPSPRDVIRPLAVFLEAVQFLQLDPQAKDLTSDLIGYAQGMAQAHTLAAQNEEAGHE